MALTSLQVLDNIDIISNCCGYAIAWNADKSRVLQDAATVSPGDTVRVKLSRGEIEAKVSGTE